MHCFGFPGSETSRLTSREQKRNPAAQQRAASQRHVFSKNEPPAAARAEHFALAADGFGLINMSTIEIIGSGIGTDQRYDPRAVRA